jgi:hypothetical protein
MADQREISAVRGQITSLRSDDLRARQFLIGGPGGGSADIITTSRAASLQQSTSLIMIAGGAGVVTLPAATATNTGVQDPIGLLKTLYSGLADSVDIVAAGAPTVTLASVGASATYAWSGVAWIVIANGLGGAGAAPDLATVLHTDRGPFNESTTTSLAFPLPTYVLGLLATLNLDQKGVDLPPLGGGNVGITGNTVDVGGGNTVYLVGGRTNDGSGVAGGNVEIMSGGGVSTGNVRVQTDNGDIGSGLIRVRTGSVLSLDDGTRSGKIELRTGACERGSGDIEIITGTSNYSIVPPPPAPANRSGDIWLRTGNCLNASPQQRSGHIYVCTGDEIGSNEIGEIVLTQQNDGVVGTGTQGVHLVSLQTTSPLGTVAGSSDTAGQVIVGPGSTQVVGFRSQYAAAPIVVISAVGSGALDPPLLDSVVTTGFTITNTNVGDPLTVNYICVGLQPHA